ncbi:MAG: hypothetical protein K9G33_03405 [Sneathiella sp.]|nr:hypothetical protein [Sneathiella sp.]
MTYRITLDRSFIHCDVITRDYGGELLHLTVTTGLFAREQRILVFEETLKINSSDNYFYILDNRAGHEILLSPEDMSYMNGMLFDAGIRYIRGAVVTNDDGYGALVAMAQAKAKAANFEVDLIATADYVKAQEFILSNLRKKLKS